MAITEIGYGRTLGYNMQGGKGKNTAFADKVLSEFAEAMEEEAAEKENSQKVPVTRGVRLNKHIAGMDKAPYSELAKDGIIEYNSVIFVCDYEHNCLCLGDTTQREDCINIPLSGGGSLLVNRDNIGDLSKAIGMFSPEDVNRILRALAQDKKLQEMQKKLDDMENSIGEAPKETAELENSETKFKIGNQEFTIEEWKHFLEKFDRVQDAIREALKEKIKKQEEERLEKERLRRQENREQKEPIEDLLAQSIKTAVVEENTQKSWYITCYTENGMWCKKVQGEEQSEEMWRINFTKPSQYERVAEYCDRFEKQEEIYQAKEEGFWRELLEL